MLEVPKFVIRHDRAHEALCIQAIRERRARQAAEQECAHWLGRDDRGRFERKVVGAAAVAPIAA